MSVIQIESNPISAGGVCDVVSGQPVDYTIVGGISDNIYVTYEWYLNDTLVSIGTGYTLTNP